MKGAGEAAAAPPIAAAEEPYSLQLDGTKIALSVARYADGKARVTPGEILSACKKRNWTNVDKELVGKMVADPSGKPGVIGEYHPKPAAIEVQLSSDRMEAAVQLSPPEDGGPAATEEALRLALKIEGVVFGLDEEAIARLARVPVYEHAVTVAHGQPVEPGHDGTIEYMFEIEKKYKPHVQEDTGKVDYKDMNLVENVIAGQLLAVRHPPTQGTSGITVKKEYVPAPAGKPARLMAGKNAVLSEDGNEVKAETNGIPMVHAGKIVVSQVYTVPGSVGPSSGNIDFLGTVEIADSVEDGYSVKATEHIIIGKTVGSATITAGGNISIRGGVMGRNSAKVTAAGDIHARFIQEASIEAGKDVIVNEAILHSNIEAGGRIVCGLGGKKGTIAGGQIRALILVAARTLGSPMSTKTLVDVGANPKLLSRSEALQEQILKERKNFDNVRKGITALTAIREKVGSLPADKQHILQTLELANNSLKTKLQELVVELKDVQAQLEVDVKGAVSVEDELYPGVKITISGLPYYVTQTEKFITLKVEAREIRTHTYEAPRFDHVETRPKSHQRRMFR